MKLYVHSNVNSQSEEYWEIDFEQGFAKLCDSKPNDQNIRKWNGTISDFLTQRGSHILEETKNLIRFKAESQK